MAGITVLLIDDGRRAEFAPVVAALRETVGACVAVARSTALRRLEAGEVAPDVIVVAQSYPGEFSHAALARLQAAAPLARIVMLLGSWCEGEMRSGRPWPGALRAYWHQWPQTILPELRRLGQGLESLLSLSLTASEEERLLAVSRRTGPRASAGGCGPLVAIYTPAATTADWLASVCRDRGLSTVWLRSPRTVECRGAAAVLFDAWRLDDEQCAALRHLAEASRPAPVIVLADFPRYDDLRRALHFGAAAVLSKPVAIEQLYGQIEAALAASSVRED